MTMSADISLHHRSVFGTTMAYRELGRSDAPHVLFLHGNPTSSYIWRNIMPLVAPVGHCIAPDLIGYGQSGKPDIAYRFFDHADYLDALIDELGISSAYLVAQDWGTALAFHLAARRPQLVRGLAFMEFIRPMRDWSDFHQHEAARDTFRKFRTPGVGEAMILDNNAFVERVLPGNPGEVVDELQPPRQHAAAVRQLGADLAGARAVSVTQAGQRVAEVALRQAEGHGDGVDLRQRQQRRAGGRDRSAGIDVDRADVKRGGKGNGDDLHCRFTIANCRLNHNRGRPQIGNRQLAMT